MTYDRIHKYADKMCPVANGDNNNAPPHLMCVASLSHSSLLVQYTMTLSQEARLPPSASIETRARSRSPSRDTVRVRLPGQ